MRSRRTPCTFPSPAAPRGVSTATSNPALPSDKHGGPFTTRPPPKLVWGQPPSAVRPSAARLTLLSRDLLPRHHHDWLHTRHHRRTRIRTRAIHVDDLPWFRRHQAQAPRHHIDALRITQRRLGQAQCAVHLRKVAELALRRLDLITVFNGLEVLPCISEHQQE